MTIYPPDIQQQLNQYHIFLDTNVFIYASKNESFFNFLADLNNNAGCSFTTIPSVLFEFTRGADTARKYTERTDFLISLVDAINPMSFINSIPDFYTVMAKVNAGNKSYTDFLLAACLYQYRRAKTALLTTDIKAFPPFYPRAAIISVEHTNDIINFGVFEFDGDGYAAAARSILEESS
jgi:predicted nucleic acid-binding protein